MLMISSIYCLIGLSTEIFILLRYELFRRCKDKSAGATSDHRFWFKLVHADKVLAKHNL